MRMKVGFSAIPIGIVVVLVVDIVAMWVLVHHCIMPVVVGVMLRQVQPDARGHQASSQPENCADRLAKDGNRQCRANKGCG